MEGLSHERGRSNRVPELSGPVDLTTDLPPLSDVHWYRETGRHFFVSGDFVTGSPSGWVGESFLGIYSNKTLVTMEFF